VNPFYIEPPARGGEWDGDWARDKEDDDEQDDLLEEEEEGLLEEYANGHRRPHDRRRDDGGAWPSRGRGRPSSKHNPAPSSGGGSSGRPAVLLLVALAVAFAVLSLSGGGGNKSKEGGSDGSAPRPGQPPPAQGAPARQIIVLGERHSGVPWLVESLPACFKGGGDGAKKGAPSSVSVRSGWTREGYWFQDPADGPVPRNSSVIVYAVRDPYEWVEMMRRDPINAPGHYNQTSGSPLAWRAFVGAEWSVQRPDRDYQQSPSHKCQLGFGYDQVVPCHARNDTPQSRGNPVYELEADGNHDGRPYPSLLDLRAAKIRHVVLDLAARWGDGLVALPSSSPPRRAADGLVLVRYENATLSSVLRGIRRATGWTYDCSRASAPPSRPPRPSPPLSLEGEYRTYLTSRLDWEAERMVGYDAAA
jgi:hypothetical protein